MKRRTLLVISMLAALAAPTSIAQANAAITAPLIAFSSNRAGPAHIFTIAIDGSGERQLTTGATDDIQPAWSATTRDIAFSRGTVDGASNFVSTIWVMHSDGSGAHALAAPAGTSNFRPTWSPNGKRIAFSRTNGGMTGSVWVMNADGTDQHQLTAGIALDDYPAWSPDGRSIAFFSTRDGVGDVYVIEARGTDPANVRRVTVGATGRAPSWAPGREIVFQAPGTGGGGGQVWAIASDGSDLHQVVVTTGEDRFPVWGPHRLVAYSHSDSPGCSTGPCGYQIWVKAGSAAPRQVTATPGAGLAPGETTPAIG
jgi:Tol biopolymer transport system component